MGTLVGRRVGGRGQLYKKFYLVGIEHDSLSSCTSMSKFRIFWSSYFLVWCFCPGGCVGPVVLRVRLFSHSL